MKLERVCCNCNYFFPASMDDPTEFGICLEDKVFEPFLDELLDDYNYDRCRDLVEAKKFTGAREACPNFSEMEQCEEVGDDNEFVREIKSHVNRGSSNEEKWEGLYFLKELQHIDFESLPVDQHSRQLRSSDIKERDSAISHLNALIGFGSKAALQELFLVRYVPRTIENSLFPFVLW